MLQYLHYILKELKHLQKEYKKLNLLYKYNWEGIDYPSGKNDWEKIEKNNLASNRL